MDLGAVTSEITRNLWISKGTARIASNCDRDYVGAIMARSDDEPARDRKVGAGAIKLVFRPRPRYGARQLSTKSIA
ncbi:hypothetical protein LB553_09065 [Mesorhizobium sp. CA8]|uniref:hypothetical protein n=1 Tax=unclassified Mesorhizobium TaxID=325217 RepID=UPI001CCF04AF|nr:MULTISPECIES: hypothetical protein [unclassified Mesorhizobium]MBZ9761023.1 hypothetical protein [Mesorhizobium sp. CA8]MBZ9820931.1 hypothetical protein [Mesorhizobium sp. CA4]